MRRPRFGLTAADRMWAKVDKSGDCWLWTGCKLWSGYGRLQWNGHDGYVHRFSWELHYGPIPEGMRVLHHCDVRLCVRPDHLFLGTDADNSADMVAKGRQSRGRQLPHTKLSESDVRAIRQLRAAGLSFGKIGAQYGVAGTTIRAIDIGYTWSWVS